VQVYVLRLQVRVKHGAHLFKVSNAAGWSNVNAVASLPPYVPKIDVIVQPVVIPVTACARL
jgi:hypothetical protein